MVTGEQQGVTLEGSSGAVGGAGVSRAALRGSPLTHKALGLLPSLADAGFWMNTMFGGMSKASVLGVSVDAELCGVSRAAQPVLL